MNGRLVLRSCLAASALVVFIALLMLVIAWPRMLKPVWKTTFILKDQSWPTKFKRLQPYGVDKLLDVGLMDQTVLYDYKGQELWTAANQIGGQSIIGTAVAADGSIYVVTKAGEVHAFDPQQQPRWDFPVTGTDDDSYRLVVGADGTVYVTAAEEMLYAISAAGELLWREDIAGLRATHMLAIGPDGTIYSQSTDNELLAIAPGGQLKWRGEPQRTRGKPTLFSQEHIIVVYRTAGRVIAYNSDGTVAWTYSAKMKFDIADSTTGADGTIYVHGVDDLNPSPTTNNNQQAAPAFFIPRLLALNPAGQLKWSVPFNCIVGGDFTVLPDNRVCIVDPGPNSVFFALPNLVSIMSSKQGLNRLSVIDTKGKIRHLGWIPELMLAVPPVVLPDGKLLLLSPDQVMYCYQP